MRILKLFAAAGLCLSSTFLLADPNQPIANPNQTQMLKDLDFINHLFHISYAPFQWKIDQFQWDLEQEINTSQYNIVNDPTFSLKIFQNLIKKLCHTTKDYHVLPEFYSTAWASLPFRIQRAEGRFFVSEIDTFDLNTPDHFPLSIGDEILSFDGKPIHEAIESFMNEEIGSNYIGTDQALAEFYLTHRGGSYGHEIPKGKVEITFCRPFSQKPRRASLKWDSHPETVINIPMKSLHQPLAVNPHFDLLQLYQMDSFRHPAHKDSFSDAPYLQKSFMTPHCQNTKKNQFSNSSEPSELLGARRGPLPYLGTVLWESDIDIDFHAYLFLMNDTQVGAYIRIPSFYAENGDAASLQFAEIIELFEKTSNALVIDQTSNGGGLILYLYALSAMLTDYPLEVPQHRVMLTQEDVYFAAKSCDKLRSITSDRNARKLLGDTVEGFTVNLNLVKSLLSSHQFVIDEWQAGKRFTDFSYIYGIHKIHPHPDIQYTKPILILTNHLDFSAADFFPAIMQDNKRAKIMGTRTAGAGGYIEKISFPNLSGIKQLDLTASFSIRPNGSPLENLGVTPDIPYEITAKDLQNDYVEYKRAILQELTNMISESEEG